jgi:tRNA(His) 5'-end guanylyltransferase
MLHATCDHLVSFDSREVIYFSYLPNNEKNKSYHKKQADNLKNNVAPPAYSDTVMSEKYNDDLTNFQKNLLGL